MQNANTSITAAMLAIGDELLSGRTKDKNIGYLAEILNDVGIDLKEVRIVGDDRCAIMKAVNDLRTVYNYVFTSGGIGPTHDDITAEAISAAFGVPCEINRAADELLRTSYEKRGLPYTEARRLMARGPRGATLIANRVSVAPGYRVDNVFVMAGVPSVFSAMLAEVVPLLRKGHLVHSISLNCTLTEGVIGTELTAIQNAHPEVKIGSYPSYEHGKAKLELVVRSRDKAALAEVRDEIIKMMTRLEANSQIDTNHH